MPKTNLATATDPRAQLDYLFDPTCVRRQRWEQQANWVLTKNRNWRTDIEGLRYVVFHRGTRFGWGVAAPGGKGIDWRPQLYHTMDGAKAAACLDYCLRDQPEPNAEQAVEASAQQAQAPTPRTAFWRFTHDPVFDRRGLWTLWVTDIRRVRFVVARADTGEFVWGAYELLNHRDVVMWPDTYATDEAAKAAVVAAHGYDLSGFH
jgi:hypothetical protein